MGLARAMDGDPPQAAIERRRADQPDRHADHIGAVPVFGILAHRRRRAEFVHTWLRDRSADAAFDRDISRSSSPPVGGGIAPLITNDSQFLLGWHRLERAFRAQQRVADGVPVSGRFAHVRAAAQTSLDPIAQTATFSHSRDPMPNRSYFSAHVDFTTTFGRVDSSDVLRELGSRDLTEQLAPRV